MRLSILSFLFLIGACNVPPEPFTEKRLIIAAKETVRLPEVNITLTNNGCGREWGDSFERVFCDLVIKGKDSTIHLRNAGLPAYLGVIKVEIDWMNPWGREEDSIPPGGCRVIVTKLPDNTR